jgi:hypothetical protein
MGLGNHFDLENSRKRLHLLPLLLAIYFSPLYIFRAIGRTVFIVNQLGHALPTDV